MSIPSSNSRWDGAAPRYSAALAGSLAATVLWLLDLTGFLLPLDGLAYDTCLRLGWSAGSAPAAVLLLEWDEKIVADKPEVYPRILTALAALGAEQVVFTFWPENAPSFFHDQAARQGNVLFGRPLLPDAEDPDVWKLAALPGVGAASIPWGVVHRPPVERGVARRQYATFPPTLPLLHQGGGSRFSLSPLVGEEQGSAESHLNLELAAARRRLADPSQLPADTYYVGFRGGPGSLPHVPLQDLLAERLVPELVQGRTVLVGKTTDLAASGFFTPFTPNGPPMSLLEFQGQALDSLLLDRAIQSLAPAPRLLLLILATSLSALLCHGLDCRLALVVGALLLAASVVVTVLSLVIACRWLPLVGLVAGQVLCLFTVLGQKAIDAHKAARQLLLSVSASLPERTQPANFYHAPDPWPLVVNLVTQTLDLNRFLFLETVEGSWYLREAAACNGTALDLQERRRDYRRDPYQIALRVQGPVRLDPERRLFPAGGPHEEHHYLIPLVLAGKVLGFWALAVAPEHAVPPASFEPLLRDYARQIAEQLYHRRFLAAEARRPWWRCLAQSGGEEPHDALGRTVRQLERRVQRGDRVFAESSTPTIIYDLFGQVREVNAAMLAHLREVRLAADLRPGELVAALTGKGLPFARQCLRYVLHEKQGLALPVQPSHLGAHFLLRLYPLRAGKEEGLHEPAPFNLQAICCELADRTAEARLHQIKEQLTGRVSVHLRNDLAAVELSASMLGEDGLSAPEREEMSQLLHGKVGQVVETLARFQEYLALDVPAETDRLPVDALGCLQAALQAVDAQLKGQALECQVTKPDLLSYVLAAPEHLRQFLEYVLVYLIRDTRPGGRILVRVEETESAVLVAFVNSGFGLANGRLREYLLGEEALVSEEFKHLRAGARLVRAWGGAVEADSTPGEGTSLRMVLPRFG